MDCKFKTWTQVWFIALFIPTLLWGYGKTAVGSPQNDEDPTIGVGGNEPRGDNSESNNSESNNSESNGARGKGARGNGVRAQKDGLTDGKKDTQDDGSDVQLETKVSAQAANPIADNKSGNSPAEKGNSKNSDGKNRKDGQSKSEKNSAESASSKLDPGGTNRNVEPDLTNGTYNQVRAKKPSIPSRFDGQNGYDARNNQGGDLNRVSLVGLLGIPTVVFGVLFFVMWGIISGRIQRIMF